MQHCSLHLLHCFEVTRNAVVLLKRVSLSIILCIERKDDRRIRNVSDEEGTESRVDIDDQRRTRKLEIRCEFLSA